MLHAATDHATLQKVEDCSTFPATRLAIFRCETSCKEGCYTRNFFCNLSRNGVALQVARKIASCNRTFSLQGVMQTFLEVIRERRRGGQGRGGVGECSLHLKKLSVLVALHAVTVGSHLRII